LGSCSVYDKLKRNYDFQLDWWTMAEDFGVFGIDEETETYSKREIRVTDTTRQGGKEVIREETHTLSESVKTTTKLDDKHSGHKVEFCIDAFHFGNWTRFCNHKCNTNNAAPRPVYVDEIDPRRPLWVFFATQDIKVSHDQTTLPRSKPSG